MMKCLLTFLLCLLTFRAAWCQDIPRNTGISGRVIDSVSRQPVEYAMVALFLPGSTKAVTAVTSNGKGLFSIENQPAGDYQLRVSFMGYQAKTQAVRLIAGSSATALGNILLVPKVQALNGVTISAQKNVIENRIDKLVYNAGKDISSQTGVATDVLKKVPQLSVDADGNVELQGSGNILFLINGKPSTIFGSNITDVLQAIPANQIDRIEVLTNPGAKYDAQGTGGIINIILKHDLMQGVNGNVSLTAGSLLQNGSVNINVRQGKFGWNAFVNGNARLTTTTPSNSQRIATDTATKTSSLLKQNGSGDFNRHGFQSGAGFDWTINDKNILSGALNYAAFGNHSENNISQLQQIPGSMAGTFVNTYSTNATNNAFQQYSIDPSFDFKHQFKDKDQQLEIGADASFAHNSIIAGNDQYIQPRDSLIYGTRNHNPARENEYEIKADYVQPLHKDINLGIGGKFSGYDIASSADASVWKPAANNYVYNTALSNNLNYHQKVYAAYTELNFPIESTLQVRLGGRYERTQLSSFYANAQQTVDKGYNTFIPSVFLMKKISEAQTFKISYTIRINRPDYSDLNPFINTSDPQNISTGNPDLKPEIWDRYEASYNHDLGKTGSLMITLFYRQSNGDIQPFSIYYSSIPIGDTTYNHTTVTTRKNIGVEKNMGTNVYFDLHLTEKLELRSNLIYFYRHTINQVDAGYNSSTNIYRLTANAAYQFSSSWAAEVFGSYNSRHHEAQGYYPSFTAYTFALRKLFWNKKGSIALTANNIFAKYVDQQTDLYGPGFVSNSLRRIPYQSVGLNFTWKFGKMKLREEQPDDHITDLNPPQQ